MRVPTSPADVYMCTRPTTKDSGTVTTSDYSSCLPYTGAPLKLPNALMINSI